MPWLRTGITLDHLNDQDNPFARRIGEAECEFADQFTCTLRAFHSGQHVAHVGEGATIVGIWFDSESELIGENRVLKTASGRDMTTPEDTEIS